MRNPGDFDVDFFVLGPSVDLLDLASAVSSKITSTANTRREQGDELVAHSHSIVPVPSATGPAYVAAVITCFDTGHIDTTGDLTGTILSVGPFSSVRAANGAIAGEIATGSYLEYERNLLAFAGMSHSIVAHTTAEGTQYFATAEATYRTPPS